MAGHREVMESATENIPPKFPLELRGGNGKVEMAR